MLQNYMTTHGSYGMIFVIHNQPFFMLGEILSNPFNLLDVMTQNTSHSLKLKVIHKGTFEP
jgi:hypothetical protein